MPKSTHVWVGAGQITRQSDPNPSLVTWLLFVLWQKVGNGKKVA